MKRGKFVISLDFELFWGVRDCQTKESYGSHILKVHNIIPELLQLFNRYQIHATFSTVGLLFYDNKQSILKDIPKVLPQYQNTHFSPYEHQYIDQIGQNEQEDKYHYGLSLIKQIQAQPQHEIGTHTFSHYYCLEPGQTITAFRADLEAAKKIASEHEIKLESLVFPRNQFNNDYLETCKQQGILCYRGNEEHWIYQAKNGEQENIWRRIIRLADSYLNITGPHIYSTEKMKEAILVNIPASRFLRPYHPRLSLLEPLKLNRIKHSMTLAAKQNKTFHLWWHPHNFGAHTQENFSTLENILKHYVNLQQAYQFESVTMTNLAKQILHAN